MKSLLTKKSGQAAVELAIFGSLILLAFSMLLMYGQRLDNQQQVKMEAFRRAMQKAYERNGSVSYTLKKEGRTFNLFSGFGQGQPSTVGSTASVLWQKGLPGDQNNETSESYAFNAINDQEVGSVNSKGLPRYPKIQINAMGNKSDVWVPVSIYSEDQQRKEFASNTVTKEESPSGGIVNTRKSELSDTITTTPHVRMDITEGDATKDSGHYVPDPNYVYENESYTFTDSSGNSQNKNVVVVPGTTLGAYATDDNRVDYRENTGTPNTISKERSWETDN